MRTRTAVAAAYAAVFLSMSCFDQRATPTAPDASSLAKGGSGGKLKSIAVSPSSASIIVGNTAQLTASATPGNVSPTYTWSSSNTAVATVSQSGLVSAIAAGTATISASSGGVSGTSSITVTPVPSG